ncbi:MAG TPA: hypothetical protein VFL57_12545 [Bryobacteraceae bacterium]|nr:hypothetical protein [Bryobacteraceae bacterium]
MPPDAPRKFDAGRDLPVGSALLAGLLTATALTSALVLVPLGFSSWAGVLVAAIGYVAIAAGACAAAFLISVLLRVRHAPDGLALVTVTCAALAAWVPAFVIFFMTRSRGTAAVAALLALAITAILREPETASPQPPSIELFSPAWVTETGPWFRKRLRFFGASALLESAAVLAMTGEVWGPVFLSTAGAVALGLTIPAPSPMRWPAAGRRGAAIAASAVVLTLIALRPYVRRGFFGGSAGDAASSGATQGDDQRGDRAAATTHVGPTWPGVILWTEEQRHAVLIPPLPRMSRTLFDAGHAQPMSIPFFGSYWFFRKPHNQPPPTSIVIRGRPTEKGFRSTDRIPLVMQAHQNLGRLIDITCCRGIMLALSNADRWPGTVAIELLLLNTAAPDRPSLSLGRQEVNSSRYWRPSDDGLPVPELLTFNVPANPALRDFDEFVVLFHLGSIRADKSAKIAIERFVLLPA